ncbi:response regulator [Paenibacillus sp. XY044]|uniref:response regulator transcription factor n=1 Tax=Paenibacillus sp. XY044 TaxID=2026089 RepID=UPI000B9947FF|nr:response regulator [Paenibacillus sp. XY044]OZB96417.1 DNA-binding response regulator [Paenibacillus sp. XY044]
MAFKVLLIDDEPAALEGLELWIDWEELGFEICGSGSNGAEGLRMIRELEPDLVITDVRMPLMDGLEMIEAWSREGTKPVKFAIVSGYGEFKYAQKALRYGVNAYLLKPVIPEEAADQIRDIRQELEREREERSLTKMASYEEAVMLIKELLDGGPDALGGMEEEANRLSDAMPAWNMCLVQADPENLARLWAKAAAMAGKGEYIFLVDLEVHGFGIVYGLNLAEDNEPAAAAMAEELLAGGIGDRRVFMAVGQAESSLLRIGRCCKTAKRAIRYAFYRDQNPGLIRYDQVRHFKFEDHFERLDLFEEMLQAVLLLDKPALQKALQSADSSLRESKPNPDFVKKIAIHVMYQIMSHMRETAGPVAEPWIEKYDIPRISGTVMTLGDVMDDLLSCAEGCIDLFMQEQQRQSQGIAQEITDYVREHYRKPLTIRKLAEVFYLHPVYLGQLLLKKNGISFNEMLHNLRIEEAVRLLENSRLKNSEIAERIGYGHYGQFLKQFEARHAMSPNEYKKRMF